MNLVSRKKIYYKIEDIRYSRENKQTRLENEILLINIIRLTISNSLNTKNTKNLNSLALIDFEITYSDQ